MSGMYSQIFEVFSNEILSQLLTFPCLGFLFNLSGAFMLTFPDAFLSFKTSFRFSLLSGELIFIVIM